MNIAFKTLLISAVCSFSSFSYTFWQTTHGGQSSGNCGLLSNTLSITVYPHFADVVEEAEISALGSVDSGDVATLEITGIFDLSPGSAIRSMLLWHGKNILKAKLLLRADADSAYEEVVDRDKIVYVPHDPAIIQYLGGDRYQFKIYPVAIGNSRQIRIRYAVPLKLVNNKVQFNIFPAFTIGTSEYPTQIPVKILRSGDMFDECIIQYGTVKKNVVFNSNYLIPYSYFIDDTYDYTTGYYSYSGIVLSPVMKSDSYWIQSVIDSGTTRGNYYAIIVTQPDINVLAIKKELRGKDLTMEASIKIGGKEYLADVPMNGSLFAYIKSEEPWDSTIVWSFYNNSSGDKIIDYTQKFGAMINSEYCPTLPLLWGAKYSLQEKSIPLGALYGFVDSRMSLLALEKDSLPQALRDEFQDAGVPLLTKDEILIKPDKRPNPPKESVLFDFNTTGVQHKLAALPDFAVSFANNTIKLQFSGNPKNTFSAVIVDALGRVVRKLNDIKISGNTAELKFHHGLNGAFFIHIISGGTKISKKVVLL